MPHPCSNTGHQFYDVGGLMRLTICLRMCVAFSSEQQHGLSYGYHQIVVLTLSAYAEALDSPAVCAHAEAFDAPAPHAFFQRSSAIFVTVCSYHLYLTWII